jgi:hypothetical protein
MGRHKKSHNQSHRRREQFEPGSAGRHLADHVAARPVGRAARRDVYVIGARGQAGSPGVMTDVAVGGDVTVPVTMLADGAARFYRSLFDISSPRSRSGRWDAGLLISPASRRRPKRSGSPAGFSTTLRNIPHEEARTPPEVARLIAGHL